MRNNKFIDCNDSPELNWGIELKLETSPTSPSKKQMTVYKDVVQLLRLTFFAHFPLYFHPLGSYNI